MPPLGKKFIAETSPEMAASILRKLRRRGVFRPIIDFGDSPVIVHDLTSGSPLSPLPKGTFGIGKVTKNRAFISQTYVEH